MNDGFLPFSRKELRQMETPEGMARALWRRVYRDMRLWWRGENARIDYEIMWGDPSKACPVGILNVTTLSSPILVPQLRVLYGDAP